MESTDPLPNSESFGCFHLLLVSRSLMQIFSMLKMLTSLVCHHEDPNCSYYQFNKSMPTMFLLPWLLPSLMTPFLPKCSMAFVSLTLGCFLQVETLLPKNLFMENIYLDETSISWTSNILLVQIRLFCFICFFVFRRHIILP